MCAFAESGERVRVLIRDGSKARWFPDEQVVVGDMFDRESVRRAVRGIDTVVHVPPRVYPRPGSSRELAMHRRAHVESTRLLLDAAVEAGVGRVILVSSAHATGRDPDRILCELDPAPPRTPYAQAKLEAEELTLSYAERYDIHAVVLRPVSIYGPNDKSLVSWLIGAARKGLWLPLKGLSSLHSLVFVETVARAGIALLKATGRGARPGVFIVTDGKDYSPSELYAAVCRALGESVRLFYLPPAGLRVLAFMGMRARAVPGLVGLGLLQHLMTSQRYCVHLFRETVPDFAFVGLDQAIQRAFAAPGHPVG